MTDAPATARAQADLDALVAAIAQPTIAGTGKDPAAFAGLHEVLRTRFPALFAACEEVDLGEHALLLRWPGRDHGAEPVVLMAHQDVVPPGDETEWTHPPYGGVVADGHVWGRGTLDDKGSLVALCAAVDRLAGAGRLPERDVWLSFGSDEEVMGSTGERAAAELQRRGVRPWFVLDEGGALVDDALPGLRARFAMIGVAEKGQAEVELRAAGRGGHASQPPRHGAAGRLARAIVRLEDHPAPPALTDPVRDMLAALGPHLPAPARLVTDHAARLSWPVAHTLAALGPELAALTRTTVAVTQLSGSSAANVLPASASAVLNVRVGVGESVDDAVRRIRRTIRDPKVEVILRAGSDPSPVAPLDEAWACLAAAVARREGAATPVPYLVMAATDGRHFHRRWPRVYRFAPFVMTKAQRQSIHGVDERVGVDDFLAGIEWYVDLLEHL